ncbi:MAG: YlbG family protein [Limosilactobacillus sp.]|uniref:YlbG family protein n=1 Tax=Limosilactobacillus sp. TaxID=2773925 RepID=UPI002708212E|nr:YlbG family protein [Limosilactobacillus sp.]
MMELTQRRGLIVKISTGRAIRSLRRYGTVRYYSRKMHYAVFYVDQAKIEETTEQLQKLHAVRSVTLSYRPDLDPTLTDLEMTGVYKSHDEDDME